jgi:uncharacterized protein
VKAVVDAYDGDVTLYLTDSLYGERDPIARSYAKAFPDLFTPIKQMPEQIRSHLRYPEDMFRVQTTMWGRYHQETAEDFYNNSDEWDVAQDPGNAIKGATTGTTQRDRIAPYYLEMRLPGDTSDRFLLFRPFVPHSSNDSKKQLTSFMVADNDPADYGKLRVYTMTQTNGGEVERNRDVDGPLTVHNQIFSTTQNNISQELTLLNSGGSRVLLGNLLIVPLGEALLYVRPVYVAAAAADSVPELRRVILAMGDRTEVGTTLQEAIDKLFPGAGITTQEGGDDQAGGPEGTPGETPTENNDPAGLIADALKLFADADAALKAGGAGSLAEYADLNAQAAAKVEEAQKALNALDEGTPTGAASTDTVPADSQRSSTSTTLAGGATTTTTPVTTTTGKA